LTVVLGWRIHRQFIQAMFRMPRTTGGGVTDDTADKLKGPGFEPRMTLGIKKRGPANAGPLVISPGHSSFGSRMNVSGARGVRKIASIRRWRATPRSTVQPKTKTKKGASPLGGEGWLRQRGGLFPPCGGRTGTSTKEGERWEISWADQGTTCGGMRVRSDAASEKVLQFFSEGWV
jgi:hypothetical protein